MLTGSEGVEDDGGSVDGAVMVDVKHSEHCHQQNTAANRQKLTADA